MSWHQMCKPRYNDWVIAGRSDSQEKNPGTAPSQPDQARVQARVGADSVRWEKVLALRAAIERGSYRVAAGDVADRMLRSANAHNHTAEAQMYSA